MKKLLLSSYSQITAKLAMALNNLIASKTQRLFLLGLVSLLLTVGFNQHSQAQTMYYLGSDGTSNTNNANDAIFKINQDGTGKIRVVDGVSAPQDMVLDLPNNRAFVTSQSFAGSTTATPHGLYKIDLTTGAKVRLVIADDSFRISSLAYDPLTDYIYFTSNDGNGTTGTVIVANDALNRIKSDGTGRTVLASGISPAPRYVALDIPNNKIYVYDPVVGSSKLMTFNLGTSSATLASTVNTVVFNGMDYDPVNNWIYYTTDNGSTAETVDDALWRMRPNGDSKTKIIGNLSPNPNIVTVERTRNIAFVWNSTGGDRRIVKVDVAAGTKSAFPVSPPFDLSNMLAAIVIPPASKVATLSNFTISSGTLSPGFSSGTTSYTASVANNVSSITVTPTKTDNFASIKVNGTTVTSGSASGSITLNIGDNVITTIVTAEDGLTTKTYTLTVNRPKAAQTITFNAIAAKTYGDADFATGGSASSGLTVSYTSSNTNVATVSGSTIHIVGAGTSTITASQAGDANYFAATNVAQTLTVNQASQTITFGTLAAKTFGDADFGTGGSVNSNLTVSYISSNTAVATVSGSTIHIVGAGATNITASQAGDANRSAASNVVQALTVNKASQTITFNAILAKTYGTADFAPGATSSAGLTLSYASDNTAVATIVSNQVHIVGQGTANITASQSGDANRLAATSVAQVLTVNKATVTVTANAQTKVYGNADPAFTYTATGVVGTDAATGALSRATPSTNRLVGDYAINQGDLSYGANYNITYVSANLTITKRPLTVAPLPVTKQYGDADFAMGAPYSFNGTSVAPEDGMSGPFGRTPTAENAGTYALTMGVKHPVDASTGEDRSANYNITFISNTFTITPKPVTVSANAQTKTYGDADPALTYVNDALAFSDSFTGALTRATGEGFGTYAITQGTLALNGNYTLTFNGNNLTIGKKTINVTANAQTKTYGTADPAFDYTNDALSFSDSFTGALTRDAGEDVGDHAITLGDLALNSNYTINYTGANLSIGKSILTYVATPASRPYLTTDPTYTGSVTGFVNGDNLASATSGTLSFATTAALSSPLGNYPINGSGLSAANYDFVQDALNNTALTITASTDATLANLTVSEGTLNPVFSSEQTSYGFAVANDVTSFNLTATVNQANATLNFNGSTLHSGVARVVPLNAGPNNLNIIVTAQDGSTTKQYTLNIFRAYDTNNMLASLNLSGLTYSPTFDTNTLNYTATVNNLVASTDVTATAVSPTTHIFVGGYDLATTNPVTTSLNVGETDVIIVSKAENGDERIYKVTVSRPQSSVATLSSIGNNSITLNAPFIGGTHAYSATVATEVGALTFLPIATNNESTIKVNNQNLNTGAGNNVNLNFGVNKITIDVTSGDGTNHITYIVNVNRLRSADATLSSLYFPFITSLNEEFNPNVFEYTATVADSTYTGIPLSAVSASENAVVKIEGTVVPRFQNYTLPVHGGPNTYHVVVTSQDTSATKTYTLVLTRAGTPPPAQSPVANLNALNVNATGFSKNFNFTIGEELTTINVPNSIAAVHVFAVSENMVSTVTVDGVTLPYDATTELLPISVGETVFTVVVTSEDGAHTKTYKLHVNRVPFADVTLASLNINTGSLTPTFVPGTKTYSVSLPNNITSIAVTPVATDGTATVKVGSTLVNSSNPTATVNIFEGPPTRVRVIVTAADGINTQTYTINVTRLPVPVISNNAKASFVFNPASVLTNSTGPSIYNYTTSVSSDVTSINIKPTAEQADAVIKVNGNIVASGAFSNAITLSPGATVINVAVTAQDGTTVNTYAITVNRAGSNNAKASFVFNPASVLTATTGSAIYNYTTSVSSDISSISIKPTAQQADAVIRVNGDIVASGTFSNPIALSPGATVINVSVTAQDGVTVNTYAITINRAGSNNAKASFVFNPASVLTSTTGNANFNYTTSVAADVSSINIKPTAEQADAVIRVNGDIVASGTYSNAIALSLGATVINVSVVAQDGVTVNAYSFTVNRNGSNNAKASFVFNPASILAGTVGTATYNYTTSVSSDLSSISLKPTAQQADAVIRVNGAIVASGTFSNPITLGLGATVINVSVTAQDGVTVNTYAFTVNRVGSNNAKASFVLNPASVLANTTGNSTYNYITSVPVDVSSISIKPTAQQADAVIRINGGIVTSGVFSNPIMLNSGSTVINVSVTAQDGVTVNTYAFTINRNGSNNAKASFAFNPVSVLTNTFGTSTYNYVTSVSADVSSINIKTTAQQANAVIRVNGGVVASGAFSNAITLNSGATLINVSVTAQDGVTVNTYAITVNRNGSTNASGRIVLSPATTLTTTTGPGNVNYAATVSSGQSSVRVIPVVNDGATATVNGAAVTGGTASDPIALAPSGSTLITVVITSENGLITKTYTVNVTKSAGSGDDLLVNRNDSKLLFANKPANNVAPTEDDGVVVHQGVSPNGDGSNDFLYIEGIDAYAGNKLSIMNTNGSLVFETKDYGKDGNNLFNGHSNKTGALLKPGTYYYALEYQVSKQSKRKTGYIVIKY